MELTVVLGPPGCGKTSYTARQARRAVEKYGRDRVLLLSLTKAAANAMRSHDLDIPPEHVGTLHSVCFHLLERPKIIKKAHLEDWNRVHPYWSVDATFAEESEEASSGWYEEIEFRRHRRTSTPEDERFLAAWRSWQNTTGVCEFTHLIESCLHKQIYFTPQPAAIFVDEYQDFSDLEIELVNRWAQDAEHLVLVGDPYQSIYGWRGASPSAMTDPTIVLKQSYRVPRAVWAHARTILECPPPPMLPRDTEGLLEGGPGRREVKYYIDRMKDLEGSWMFLFSCQFMADAFASDLRAHRVPYWNPYDPRRWNPLRLSMQRGVTTASRVRAFAEGFSTANVKLWRPLFAHVFERGATEVLDSLRDEDPERTVRTVVLEVTKEAHRGWLGDSDTREASQHLSSVFRKASYVFELIDQHGPGILEQKPRAIVGTIHSVKGGEADHVAVFPDISPLQWDQLQQDGWDGRQAVLRTFYVGMTRARESLILGLSSGGHHL